MEYHDILFDIRDHIATITLNRPEVLNATRNQSFREIADAVEEQVKKDDDIRVLVLTGTGRAFCAGDDVKSVLQAPDGQNQWQQWRIERLRKSKTVIAGHYEALLSLDKPIVASVNGPAIGGGMDLALCCDIRIASERAQFGQFFVKRGLTGNLGLSLLPRLVGLAKAYELTLTGDLVNAEEALRIGLVNKLVAHDELEAATRVLALKLASGAPLAHLAIKQIIRKGLTLDWQAAVQFSMSYHDTLVATEDHKEGTSAFTEKRSPMYKGR